MSDSNSPQTGLQFETAEFSSADQCVFCKASTGTSYYRVDGNLSCASCAEQIRSAKPIDSHSAYSRALLFGFGGALVGLCLYAGFEILTELTIGYLSLAVGWIVATAMMKGSKGIGGRRYQIAAVLLTYFAVSVAAIPVYLHQISAEKKSQPQVRQQTVSPAQTDAGTSENATAQPSAPQPKRMGFFAAMAILIGIGLISPFLEFTGGNPLSALIGLFILFIGLRIAWKLAAGAKQPQIDGPY